MVPVLDETQLFRTVVHRDHKINQVSVINRLICLFFFSATLAGVTEAKFYVALMKASYNWLKTYLSLF